MVEGCYLHRLGPGARPPASETEASHVAVVSPHAGYEYSGPVAAHSFLHVSSMRRPELVVIVAPNHYGIGSGVSTFTEGEWETPLGNLRVDSASATSLMEECDLVADDPGAHRMEHSLEVQLPFIQDLYGCSVPILPVSLAFQDQATAEAVSKALAKVVGKMKAVLVASSDLTHYEPAPAAREKDMALMKDVMDMDVGSFYETLEGRGVTACGFGAIAAVMQAASRLGLKRGELLKYASSGETTGDNLQVVGYGALRFV